MKIRPIVFLPVFSLTILSLDAATPRAGQDFVAESSGTAFVWVESLGAWVGKYEVTNAEFRTFQPEHDSLHFHGHSLNGDRQPVVEVSFWQALAFGEWLTARERVAGRLPEGFRYRLPEGEEWTVFASCGDGRTFPWGNNHQPDFGNYADSTALASFPYWSVIEEYDDGHLLTAPVEASGENPWRLFGVGGNVWEWTLERSEGGRIVLRGGCWHNHKAPQIDLDYRDFSVVPAYHSLAIGFRLILASD